MSKEETEEQECLVGSCKVEISGNQMLVGQISNLTNLKFELLKIGLGWIAAGIGNIVLDFSLILSQTALL